MEPAQRTDAAEPMPGEIHIRRRELTVLRRVLIAAMPREGCALLLGGPASGPIDAHPGASWTAAGSTVVAAADAVGSWAGAAPVLEIRLIWPCLNVWKPPVDQTRRFRLDPREQLLAQRWARQRGLQVLGSAHSHPSSAALPSATDLQLAVAPTLQLILSPREHWNPACWWLEPGVDDGVDDIPRPRRLPWKMMD